MFSSTRFFAILVFAAVVSHVVPVRAERFTGRSTPGAVRDSLQSDLHNGNLRYFYFGFSPLQSTTVRNIHASYGIRLIERGCSLTPFETAYNTWVNRFLQLTVLQSVPDLLR